MLWPIFCEFLCDLSLLWCSLPVSAVYFIFLYHIFLYHFKHKQFLLLQQWGLNWKERNVDSYYKKKKKYWWILFYFFFPQRIFYRSYLTYILTKLRQKVWDHNCGPNDRHAGYPLASSVTFLSQISCLHIFPFPVFCLTTVVTRRRPLVLLECSLRLTRGLLTWFYCILSSLSTKGKQRGKKKKKIINMGQMWLWRDALICISSSRLMRLE